MAGGSALGAPRSANEGSEDVRRGGREMAPGALKESSGIELPPVGAVEKGEVVLNGEAAGALGAVGPAPAA